MSFDLLRITTEYSEVEDRVRLLGEEKDGARVKLWETQRLLSRIAPVFAKRLEEGAREIPAPELLNAFEQERASSSMKPMPPQGRRTFFALGIRRRHDRRLWRALWYGRRIAVHVVGEVSAPGVDAYEDLVLSRIRYQKKMDFSILQRCRVVSLSC